MEKRKNNGIFYVAISLVAVLGVGGYLVSAYSGGNANNVFEGDCVDCVLEADQAPIEDDLELGGTIGSDIYHDVVFHGMTQLAEAQSNVDVELYLTPSTTATTLRGVAAQYLNNTGGDQVCFGNTLFVSFEDGGLAGWGANFNIGTTTRKDGLYLTATTSATLIGSTYVGTTTDGLLTTQMGTTIDDMYIAADSIGSYFTAISKGHQFATGTQAFVLQDQDVIVVGYDYSGATSSDNSWTNGVGATNITPGRLHVNCVRR